MTLSSKDAFWVLFATILASSMTFIDGTALNVALPALHRDLGANGSDLLWILNAYNLPLSALLLLGGALGDHYGLRGMLMIGIITFALGSLLCGFAPGANELIIARALQGVGAAISIPGSMAVISASFDTQSRGKAIGTWAAFASLTSIAGPLLGGYLAAHGLWRWIFFINLPLAVISVLSLRLKVAPCGGGQNKKKKQPLDWLGGALATLGLTGICFGFIEANRVSEPTSGQIGLALGGSTLLVVFYLWQKRAPNPMVPLELFESKVFLGTNIMTIFLYATLSGVLFFMPLNLVQVQGYNEAQAGYTMLPFMGMLVILSRFAGTWADRFGTRPLLTIGPLIVGIGYALLGIPEITSGPDSFWAHYFLPFLLLGIGMGITVSPLTTAVMSCVSPSKVGIASGINNAASRVASVLAIAIMGWLAIWMFRNGLKTLLVNSGVSLENATLFAAEAVNLAEAKVQGLSTLEVHREFIWVFRRIAWMGAGLCFLSSLTAFLTLPSKQESRS